LSRAFSCERHVQTPHTAGAAPRPTESALVTLMGGSRTLVGAHSTRLTLPHTVEGSRGSNGKFERRPLEKAEVSGHLAPAIDMAMMAAMARPHGGTSRRQTSVRREPSLREDVLALELTGRIHDSDEPSDFSSSSSCIMHLSGSAAARTETFQDPDRVLHEVRGSLMAGIPERTDTTAADVEFEARLDEEQWVVWLDADREPAWADALLAVLGACPGHGKEKNP